MAAGVLGPSAACATGRPADAPTTSAPQAEKRRSEPKRILVLGGTGFLGPAFIEPALAHGHRITIFHRGKTRPGMFGDRVEVLTGDRDPNKNEGLKALQDRSFDVVLDDSGYYPRMVKASATLLAKQTNHYIYISSVSAYDDSHGLANADETAKLAVLSDPNVETMGKSFENYGGLKAACEQAVQSTLPDRTTIIRPGYIVGPDDPTGRFTYWPVRIARGGAVLAPGTPSDPLQIIDVRDLAVFLLKLAEERTTGTFNALGPETPFAWGAALETMRKATDSAATLTFVPTTFLAKLPGYDGDIWAPYEEPKNGLHRVSNARAVKAGLRFRPLEATVRDTLAWYKTQENDEHGRKRLGGPKPEQEAEWLAAWSSRKPD